MRDIIAFLFPKYIRDKLVLSKTYGIRHKTFQLNKEPLIVYLRNYVYNTQTGQGKLIL